MTVIAGIGFTAPWLLLGLLVLPVLWLLLRAVPPAPVRRLFPGVTLLQGLRDDESQTDRTPWWLLLIRMLAVAAAILGLAGPVLNPQEDRAGSGPLLIVLDASWGGAGHWTLLQRQLQAELTEAGRAERPVAMMRLTSPDEMAFVSAENWQQQRIGLMPEPWLPTAENVERAQGVIDANTADFDTLWFSDGLEFSGRDIVLSALQDRGQVTVVAPPAPVVALRPPSFVDGAIELVTTRTEAELNQDLSLVAVGRDPGGTQRILARADVAMPSGEKTATTRLSLPSELRGRLQWFAVQGQRSAGAIGLSDDSLRRREVALIGSASGNEGLALLSPLHYLQKALVENTDLLEGELSDLLPANPDVVVLADVARLTASQEEALVDWVESGGLLLRFAGPRLAASDTSRDQEHPLMPVRLRAGGRSLGGAMSWGAPKTLAPFAENSPFFGLEIPDEVAVTSQVVAQPDPSLAERVIAELDDGTPLVTRKPVGQGQVVLFHVTANAEWSSLPLSGLFVEMLERLAVSSAAGNTGAADLEGTVWTPVQVINGFGQPEDAANLSGVAGPDLMTAPLGPNLRPGLYQSNGRSLARNVVSADTVLESPVWPASVVLRGFARAEEKPLGGWVLAAALVLLAVDAIATLAVSGLIRLGTRTAALGLALVFALNAVDTVQAQETDNPPALASEVTLGYVLTGDPALDALSRDGLRGLSNILYYRTSVEPANPAGVDVEQDELAFYPLLYWPVTPSQALPTAAAYEKLNTYLRSGGMILFDTRDADLSRAGATSDQARHLQRLARPLDIPPLEPMPLDHVLTRAFYLLQDFPGRQRGAPVWVEAAPPDAEQIEGLPFRNLNDGVTPVVIGGNDWASAWAVDENARPRLPVGRGFAGERQRELAYRFGVNLIMHVLTGNYKSDQVHVPALLDRLGQ